MELGKNDDDKKLKYITLADLRGKRKSEDLLKFVEEYEIVILNVKGGQIKLSKVEYK